MNGNYAAFHQDPAVPLVPEQEPAAEGHHERVINENLNVRYRVLWPWSANLPVDVLPNLTHRNVKPMFLETYDRGQFIGRKFALVLFLVVLAGIFTAILALGPELYASWFDARKYVSGVLGGFFTYLFVESMKAMLWGALNMRLQSTDGVSILDLKTVTSLIGGFEPTGHCSTFALFSSVICLIQFVGPVLAALVFSAGFSTVETWNDPSYGVLEVTEIGGCFNAKCIASSATLLGLLNFPITHGLHLDGGTVSGNGEVNIFYPMIPTAAVESYWSNSSTGRTPVFTLEQLPGLLVEARTTELPAYPKLKNSIETTISSSALNLSYTADINTDGSFSMDLAGRIFGSSGTATFLFTCNVSCAEADTTIITRNGNLEIRANNRSPISGCQWDNSSLELWRNFESSIGIAIRYDYNSWFNALRNDSTASRQISELLGSVITHRLSTGEATIKRFPGTYMGTTQYVEYHERVAPWTAYIAAIFSGIYLLRFVGLVWVPWHLLRTDLLSVANFLRNFQQTPALGTRVQAQIQTATVDVQIGTTLVQKLRSRLVAVEAPNVGNHVTSSAYTQM